MNKSASKFKDSSTECAICFEPLFNDSRTIILKCGHRWHLTCLRQQLEHAQPSRTSRLLFSGCRCAKCNAFCEHPALENLTRRTDSLRQKVDALIIEQLKIDASENWVRASTDAERSHLLDAGRRSYAFYLCGACDDPYFGGTIECADQEEGDRTSPEDRLCSVCSPKSHLICDRPLEHRAFHVWKCRYCCNPSTFVCYGNVHFCNSCHDRNSDRDWRRRRGEVVSLLQAIPCTCVTCQYPKLEGCDHHSNGPSVGCEQVYYCACCVSNPRREVSVQDRPGSRNFIINPNGVDGTRGWNSAPAEYGAIWTVEAMEIPVDGHTRTNFVSSFGWCIMTQTIPLYSYVINPSLVRIEGSAKFIGRTDCPSVFKMEIIVTDAQRRIIYRKHTDTLDAPVDFWQSASIVLDPVEGTHEVTLSICGKDQRFWRGYYGSKVCHCSIRVLGTEEELESILQPGVNYDGRLRRLNMGLLNRNAISYEMFLPLLLVIFLWLISD